MHKKKTKKPAKKKGKPDAEYIALVKRARAVAMTVSGDDMDLIAFKYVIQAMLAEDSRVECLLAMRSKRAAAPVGDRGLRRGS